ncbi:MAG TPA: hypothetical protein VGJ00_06635 [Rhabdochlamydiaceae bacterium]|jgi:hypothetical protein
MCTINSLITSCQNQLAESRPRKDTIRDHRLRQNDKIISLLTHCKEGEQSATGSHFSLMRINQLHTQKADKIRLAIKITATVGILLTLAALVTAVFAAIIYIGAHISYALAVLLRAGVPYRVPLVFKIPSGVTNLLIASGACAGGGVLSFMAWGTLNKCK